MRIPLFDPAPRLARVRPALVASFERILDQGAFILGAPVTSFEQELADFLGGGEVVGVASGSDALELSLRALGVGPGQAVLTTPFSFVATAEAILHVGAKPIFVDVQNNDLLLDLRIVEQFLREFSRTSNGSPSLPTGEIVSALLPVHLFGAVLEASKLQALCDRFQLKLIEDVAQALGGGLPQQRAGTLGHAGCFSFFPSKTLGGLGDGGAVWTANPELALRLRTLRQHGQPSKTKPSVELGRNSRLDALQAAMLSVLLPSLEGEIAERCALIQCYRERLNGCSEVRSLGPFMLEGHAAQQMVIRCSRRDELAAYLNAHGVGTAVYYPIPLHRLAPFQGALVWGELLEAERASQEVLAVPLYPGLKRELVDWICWKIREFYD